ncbi:hypothetical protein GCM10007036_10970 [Alsobacter metallidurans]|uniref:Uncharacterized protein n=1 Tax=Alsobacter metallidurans TaxID=340221 RepID=A0A917I5E8_9HYPH|nr:hypothetical protein GCM10007036_10970 [Alsobacter metallidurans]
MADTLNGARLQRNGALRLAVPKRRAACSAPQWERVRLEHATACQPRGETKLSFDRRGLVSKLAFKMTSQADAA